MNILVAALSIFLLRLLDQTLGTLRVLYVNKGKPVFGAVLGFVESAIWVVAISRVIPVSYTHLTLPTILLV